MAKIGIYGSSFDPITNAHLWIASTIAHRCKLDRIIFLINKGLAMEISSTYIRDEFPKGGEPRYLLPESCYEYIKTNNLYQ